MKIFIMRHGIVANPEKVVYGRLPGFHLSKMGETQVTQMAAKIANENIETIYSSPLERTIETSKIVAQKINLPEDKIIIDKHLYEVVTHDYEGMPAKDFFSMSNYKDFFEDEHRVARRMLYVFQEGLTTKAPFLIISHSDPIMALIEKLEEDYNLNYNGEYIRKSEIIILEYSDGKLTYLETLKPSIQA